MKNFLAILMMLVATSAAATDLPGPINRSSNGKQCTVVTVSGAATNALCADASSGTQARIGIGTSTPGNLLHVLGASSADGFRLERTGASAYDMKITGVMSGSSQDLLMEPSAANSGFFFKPHNSSNVGSNTAAFGVDRNGFVGIGTTTPSANQLLTVAGGASVVGAINQPNNPTSLIWQMQFSQAAGGVDNTTTFATVDTSANQQNGVTCLLTTVAGGANSASGGGNQYGVYDTMVRCGFGVGTPWCTTVGTTTRGAAGTGTPSVAYSAISSAKTNLIYHCNPGGTQAGINCMVTVQCSSWNGAVITNLINP